MYKRTAALKKSNPRLKILLAIGGWRAGSGPFVAVVESASTRKTFAANAAKFVRQHGFDGLDVDWEFPGSRGSGPEHKALFTRLLKVNIFYWIYTNTSCMDRIISLSEFRSKHKLMQAAVASLYTITKNTH